MSNTKNISIDTEYLKVMSVGPSGEGKSIFAASFPTPGFLFDFGDEALSYRGKDFDYESYSLSPLGWAKYEKDFITLKKCLIEGIRFPQEGESTQAKERYQTVAVDNVTAMTSLCMERALQLDPKRSETGGPIWNVHYPLVKNLMEGRLRQLIDLPANVILIAHMDVDKDKEGAVIGVGPMLTGQLSVTIPSYFQEVYYHSHRKEGNDTRWVMQTIPIGMNHGRSRLSGKERLLPDLIENDYRVLAEYITGARKKVQQTKPQPTQTK